MALFKSQKEKVEINDLSEMNAEDDANTIWYDAFEAGVEKYHKGQQEHKTQFWTAGAGWYAQNLKDEQLDLISYLHHLNERIKLANILADMMEDGEVSLRDAAKLLKNLMGNHPPQKYTKQSND